MLTRAMRLGAAVLLVAAAGACDFAVTNPGPTEDRFLDRPEAHQALANGSAYYLYDALANLAYTTSAVTRELFPAGSTSSFGISQRQQTGLLEYDDEHILWGPWTPAQRARSIGETAFERFAKTNPGGTNNYRPAVEAALFAAYAYRLLGENWCEVAFDGGPIVARDSAFVMAEVWFTKAIDAAGSTASLATQKTAAHAGRASVRMWRGNWAGALADAALVPTTFTFNARYDASQQEFYNRTYFAGAGTPYKAVTAWNTKYFDYYNQTRDPRVPWVDRKTTGDAAVLMVGNVRVPFYEQQKFPVRESPIALSSGREMRLIEAEKFLLDGNIASAMALLNARRAALNPAQPALNPANLTEAWTMFKQERGIELWLEGRRLGDLFRWKKNNTPGALHVLETAGAPTSYLLAGQTLAYPIAKGEREANKNIDVMPPAVSCPANK